MSFERRGEAFDPLQDLKEAETARLAEIHSAHAAELESAGTIQRARQAYAERYPDDIHPVELSDPVVALWTPRDGLKAADRQSNRPAHVVPSLRLRTLDTETGLLVYGQYRHVSVAQYVNERFFPRAPFNSADLRRVEGMLKILERAREGGMLKHLMKNGADLQF
jgi:hypothetical protein